MSAQRATKGRRGGGGSPPIPIVSKSSTTCFSSVLSMSFPSLSKSTIASIAFATSLFTSSHTRDLKLRRPEMARVAREWCWRWDKDFVVSDDEVAAAAPVRPTSHSSPHLDIVAVEVHEELLEPLVHNDMVLPAVLRAARRGVGFGWGRVREGRQRARGEEREGRGGGCRGSVEVVEVTASPAAP